MGQVQREAIDNVAYETTPAPTTLGFHGQLVGPFPVKSIGVFCRAIDIIGALALLIFTAPLLIFIAVIVKLQDGGSIVFAQRRIGRGGEMFSCLKIRTMVPNAELGLSQLLASDPQARAEWQLDQKLRNDPRITAFGRFLRKSSLDELPQLINVVRGEMSLVGPRPIVLDEAPRYGRWLKYYCAVQPGITGLWQTNGRNNLSYHRRVACDILYARRQSLSFNTAILLNTVPAVLMQKGSS
jgi:exopolysaccharide production protein ExoY